MRYYMSSNNLGRVSGIQNVSRIRSIDYYAREFERNKRENSGNNSQRAYSNRTMETNRVETTSSSQLNAGNSIRYKSADEKLLYFEELSRVRNEIYKDEVSKNRVYSRTYDKLNSARPAEIVPIRENNYNRATTAYTKAKEAADLIDFNRRSREIQAARSTTRTTRTSSTTRTTAKTATRTTNTAMTKKEEMRNFKESLGNRTTKEMTPTERRVIIEFEEARKKYYGEPVSRVVRGNKEVPSSRLVLENAAKKRAETANGKKKKEVAKKQKKLSIFSGMGRKKKKKLKKEIARQAEKSTSVIKGYTTPRTTPVQSTSRNSSVIKNMGDYKTTNQRTTGTSGRTNSSVVKTSPKARSTGMSNPQSRTTRTTRSSDDWER